MMKLSEDSIEQAFIAQLIEQGYTYHYGPDIAPYSKNPQRESFESVLLEQQLKNAIQKLNPDVSEVARTEAFQKVKNLGTLDLMENNERFHTYLTNGVTVEYHQDGRTRGINIKLLDVVQPENNSFWAVNQLVVKENNNEKRFDVVIFVNGIKVVMTSSSDDLPIFQPHHTTKKQRKELALRMKDKNDSLKLVIVRDMWLTGFDAPSLHTLYVDKKMQGANLMQAIARVNRVYGDKPGGLIVDYIGIGQDLRNAMAVYLQSGGEGSPIVDIREAIAGMLEKYEVVEQMFSGFDYRSYFTSEVSKRLQIILGAQNFILATPQLKDRFLKEVTLLSKLYAMSVPSPQANKIKDEIAFFQAIKSRINKFSGNNFISDYEVETAVKQIIDDKLGSDGIIDIFQAAGIESPSVSILSDEFLLEVKNMQQKNVAYELLKKLLSDEVRVRKVKNIAQGKRFSEMLESIVKRYHNNQIDSAQVLAELSEMAKEMRLEDKKSEELNLTPEEYAFYSVLTQNDSTKMLDDEKMRELIHTIVDVVRNNATVDWQNRDDVRAKLRLTVKKILMRYGYPPDLAKLEADKVLAQSENLAAFFAGK